MPRPTLAEGFNYHTAGHVQAELSLSREEFNRRLKQKILPAPSYVNSHGLRFFDDNWLRIARAIIEQERPRPQEPAER